jgi:hypothetical protein
MATTPRSLAIGCRRWKVAGLIRKNVRHGLRTVSAPNWAITLDNFYYQA